MKYRHRHGRPPEIRFHQRTSLSFLHFLSDVKNTAGIIICLLKKRMVMGSESDLTNTVNLLKIIQKYSLVYGAGSHGERHDFITRTEEEWSAEISLNELIRLYRPNTTGVERSDGLGAPLTPAVISNNKSCLCVSHAHVPLLLLVYY